MAQKFNVGQETVMEQFNQHGLSFYEENFNIYTLNDHIIEVSKFTKEPKNNNPQSLAVQLGEKGDRVDVPRMNPLLFVHGWGLTSRSYREPLSHLTSHYDVYAPTLPGFGRSSPLRSGFSLNDYAESVNRVWGECELSDSPVPIVAHSMGGGVAVKLALMTENVVESLTLICPIGGGGSPVQWGKIVASLKGDVTFDMMNHAKDSLPHFIRNPFSAMRSAYLAKTADLSQELQMCVEKGLTVNIIFATHDSITPPGTIEKISGVNYVTQSGTHGWLLKEPRTFHGRMVGMLNINE